MLVWDDLNVHRSAAMRAFIDGTDWLTVVYQAFTGIDRMSRVARCRA